MAIFCVPKHLIEKLKTSALKGEVDIKALYNMSSDERRAHFTKFTDEKLGRFLNTEFEKAMISKQKTALTDWAKSVFTPKAQSEPAYKTVLDKIKTLDDLGVLTPKSEQAFLQDLVAEKLGVTVSAEEVRQISERAEKIDKAQLALGDDLGSPDKLEENLAFFKAKKAMDDYLSSLVPSSQLKVLSGTIGRGMMLASIKSPILNIGSNTEVAITEALSRRLASGQFKGANKELALDYVKLVNKVYQATGYDLSRMESLSDTGASGARVLDDIVHTQGPGTVRKIGRVVEDIVFKQLMGAPDAAFASAHFADSVNLASLKLADGDAEQATVWMKDAMRLQPQTPEGEVLRMQAILDAETATWTDDTWASRLSLGIRKLLNGATGDFRLGDQLLPFVKTPANVIETGLDYAGLGIPKALIETVNAVRKGDLGEKGYRQRVSRDLVRSGIGLVAAALIAAQLDDDDFIGAYDPKRKQIDELRNSSTNAIRIGNKWISTDWLGPLSVGVSAIMYARKTKGAPSKKVGAFTVGAASSFLQLPGVEDVVDTLKDAIYKKGIFGDDQEKADTALNWLWSRLVPSFVGDIAKATDTVERKTLSEGLGAQIKARIPGLRQTLPTKKTIFGDEIKTEPAWSVLLFGSRVKTDKEDALVKELSDVQAATGQAINFTDWDRSSSKQLQQFRESLDKNGWEEAKKRYGFWMRTMLDEAMKKQEYKDLSPEEKVSILNTVDSEAQKKVFSQFQFKYKADKKPKVKFKF